MNRWIRRLILLAVLVGAIVGLRLTVFRADPVPVTIFRVAPGRVEETVTNSKAGTVKTRRRAALSPETGGRVEALPARKGTRVRAGALLLRLNDADQAAQVRLAERSLEAARAGMQAACATAEQAERELRRQERLAEDRIVSQDLLDRARSHRDVTASSCQEGRARVLESEAAIDVARATLDKTVLRAPFDGIVAELSTEVGEWITPSPPGVPLPPVIDLIDTDSIYVSAPLDEVDVATVRDGLPVRITMDAYPGRSFDGRVMRVAPYVLDVLEQNRTFEIEVEFDDAEFARTLLPGTSADVEVVVDTRDGVLRIPSYALMEGSTALVVREDTLVAVPVTTGLRNWEFVEVAGGLSEGDRVVVSLDRAEVKEGARVRVQGETER